MEVDSSFAFILLHDIDIDCYLTILFKTSYKNLN